MSNAKTRRFSRGIAAAAAVVCAGSLAQAQTPATLTLPDSLLAPGTQMKWVKKVPAYCEGPAVDPNEGTVYFTEQRDNGNLSYPIWKIRPDVPGDTGSRWITSSNQSNGLFVDGQGRVVAAQKWRIARYKKDGSLDSVLATSGKTAGFNQANDLSLGKDGIFFTDLGPDIFFASQGTAKIVASGINGANGIEWLEAEKVLNVQSTGVNRRYDVGADGALSNPRDFFPVSIGDGCEVDSHGNLYLADYWEGAVFVVNPQGAKIGTIAFNSQAAPYDPTAGKQGNVDNCHFGGKDWKTLYCTGDGGLYSLDLKIAGRAWPQSAASTGLRPGLESGLSRRKAPLQASRAYRADGRGWNAAREKDRGPRLPAIPYAY